MTLNYDTEIAEALKQEVKNEEISHKRVRHITL